MQAEKITMKFPKIGAGQSVQLIEGLFVERSENGEYGRVYSYNAAKNQVVSFLRRDCPASGKFFASGFGEQSIQYVCSWWKWGAIRRSLQGLWNEIADSPSCDCGSCEVCRILDDVNYDD